MPQIIYIDMDGVLCDFKGAYARDKTRHPDRPFPQSRKGFYENLRPLPGALDTVARLYENHKFSPYILTAPSIHNPLSYTEKRLWTENHLGFKWLDKLIISPDKSLLRGDILIDDHNSGHGQDRFQGQLIHFGSTGYPNWDILLSALITDA